MATEGKRQNAGNKTPVAVPNSAPTQPAAVTVSLEAALSGAVGARIRITTAASTSTIIEGTLFTADPITNLVVINTSPTPPTSSSTSFPTGSYRILPISQITTFNLISIPQNGTGTGTSTPTTFTTANPPLRPLDLNALRAREATAIRKQHELLARRGPKGTTKEAQDIFDAIARTYPAQWQGASMLVNDSVLIDKPYLLESCRAAPGAGGPAGSVERIRKVLRMERDKLELKNTRFDVGNVGKGKLAKDKEARKGG